MTYRFGGMPSRIPKQNRHRFLTWVQKEWMSVVLTFITLEIAILSIERAKWLESQPSLTFVLFLSIITGVIVAKKTTPPAGQLVHSYWWWSVNNRMADT